MEGGIAAPESGGDGGHHSPAGRAVTPGSSSHGRQKRSVSGAFLSRLSFLRTRSDSNPTSLDDPVTDMPDANEDVPPKPTGAMASVFHQSKGRSRKGSLRKRALLGTGKSKLEGRERRSSVTDPQKRSFSVSKQPSTVEDTTSITKEQESSPLHRQPAQVVNHKSSNASVDLLNGFPPFNDRIPEHGHSREETPIEERLDGSLPDSLGKSLSPVTTSTDEDDGLTFGRIRTPALLPPSFPEINSSSGSESYFPTVSSNITRSRSNRLKSPLAGHVLELATADDDWDYSETEWWGWVILIATWIVFVVGMGSCLGVWSWAWDVGETPYAPPELEDDPTLPIVGYYPALMILTCVMAWVWVFVAWIGMKYFKHAQIPGEDI